MSQLIDFRNASSSNVSAQLRIIACTKDRNLAVWALEINKAFDSVPFASIQALLHRLKIPQGYINLIKQVATRRTIRIISASIRPQAGIKQGEVNAPPCFEYSF